MKWKTRIVYLIFILLFIFSFVWMPLIFSGRLQRVEKFGELKIRDYVPSLSGPGVHIGKKSMLPAGRFFVIFINDKVDTEADLNDRRFYSEVTDMIVEKGGHFWPSGDGKAAKVFGINPILPRTRSVFAMVYAVAEKVLWDMDVIENKSNKWALDGSLIAVTDGQGEILVLYKNAKIGDIKRVVKELQL